MNSHALVDFPRFGRRWKVIHFICFPALTILHITQSKTWPQESTSANSSTSSSISGPALPQPPSSQSHNLHSVLNLDNPRDSCDDHPPDDPADARIYGVAHMFLTSDSNEVSSTAKPIGKIPPAVQIPKRSSWVTRSPKAQYPNATAIAHSEAKDTPTPISKFPPDSEAYTTDPMEIDDTSSSKSSIISRFPPELLLQIFSHFDPPSRDTTAFLSPTSTTAALCSCTLVSRWWNRVATRVLWRRPRLYDTPKFSKLVQTTEQTSNNLTSIQTYTYTDLIQHLPLSQTLSEPHRHNIKLSPLLTRLLSLPNLQLTTLDLAFCKGVTNFALQRCAHALKSLESLNLAGGGRSEICVIKLASECRNLKRLGLGWNDGVGNFCIREVGRWCRSLEWIDLSGCYNVGDAGVIGLVRGLAGVVSSERLIDGWVLSNAPGLGAAGISFLPPPLPPPPPPPTSSSSPIPPRPLLKHINLSYCQNVTAFSVQELFERCESSLEVVNVFGCGDMTGVMPKDRRGGVVEVKGRKVEVNRREFRAFWEGIRA